MRIASSSVLSQLHPQSSAYFVMEARGCRICMLLVYAAVLVGKGVLAVPFYMYEGPAFDWFKNCSIEHAKELEQTRHRQHAGEVLFPERLVHHPERVFDDRWERAEIFVVPALFVFVCWLQWGETHRDRTCHNLTLPEMMDITANALLASPYFKAKGGHDHLIVADHYGLFYVNFTESPSMALAIQNMSFGSFETTENEGNRRPFRCTVAVPYAHKASARVNERHALLPQEGVKRDKGVFFMGKMDSRKAYVTRYTVGERIIPLTEYNMTFVTYTPKSRWSYYDKECDAKACLDAPRCVNCTMSWDAQNEHKIYERRLARSEFALMIHGDSPSSGRLYDTLAYGTIPIIISDRLWHSGLPFPGKVPWPDLVFGLEQNFKVEAFKQIMDAPKEVIKRKRGLIRKYMQEIDWHHPDSRVVDNILEETVRYCL